MRSAGARTLGRAESLRVASLYAVVLALHLAGLGLLGRHVGHLQSGAAAVYAGAGLTAYLLGVRHAFDADHIAAIDDTSRYLLQRGGRPLGVGLAFSLGHSSVVCALALGIAFVGPGAVAFQEAFAPVGGVVGPLVSAAFLYAVAGLNAVVLVSLVRTWRAAARESPDDAGLADLLARRGLINRLFRGRYERLITRSWQVFFVGLLFGLGFDTATQVAAVGLVVGSTAGGALPPVAIVALPLLFAAGMTLCDTTDGVLMVRAYGWAMENPLRRIFYNITLTGMSVLLAVAIATVEVVALVATRAGWAQHAPWSALGEIDLNRVGIGAAVLFVLAWAGAVVLWRRGGYDAREGLHSTQVSGARAPVQDC